MHLAALVHLLTATVAFTTKNCCQFSTFFAKFKFTDNMFVVSLAFFFFSFHSSCLTQVGTLGKSFLPCGRVGLAGSPASDDEKAGTQTRPLPSLRTTLLSNWPTQKNSLFPVPC